MDPNLLFQLRPDIHQAFSAYRVWLSQPGQWLTGATRIEIARATRQATQCQACTAFKDHLSARSLDEQHSCCTDLPRDIEVMVHRIVNDQNRIGPSDIERLEDSLGPIYAYVELLGIVVCHFSIDEFYRGLALPELGWPDPVAGKPDGYLPALLESETSWVPMIPRDQVQPAEADLWPGNRGANVLRALSAVPGAVRAWQNLSSVMSLSLAGMAEMIQPPNRQLSRMQMELIAGRVSALNQCLY
jgi:hypothetical protein